MKYIIFDFGKVLGYPKTGAWFITPKFIELVQDIDLDLLKESIKNNKNLVKDDMPIKNLDEEYDMFVRFYSNILEDLSLNKELAKEIAYDKVYNNNEYELYDDVIDTLTKLKEEYTLLMLTDNFPSIINYLKHSGIYEFFDKVYISSICETSKKDDKFYDMVIDDYNIKTGEILFIDDFEDNLDLGYKKGFNVIMLDRENKKESKYERINSLDELEVK